MQVITDNDQGHFEFPINNSIPTYFKAMREIYLKECPLQFDRSSRLPVSLEQEDRFLQKVFLFFDEVLALLEEEIAIHEVCRHLKGQNYREERNRICSAEMHYKEDLRRAMPMVVKIPLQQKASLKEPCKLVDGVIFYNPSSFLFKEFARADVLSSSLKNGYTLMIVHRDIEGVGQHVISVDPASECSLEGLGALLEEKEKLAEQGQNAGKRKNGKERIYEEPGRHGYGVNDPWYDGRGHSYTIIDTPSSSSLLTDAEVNELVWEYGNPCKDVEIESTRLTIFIPHLAYFGTGQGGIPFETNVRQHDSNDDVLPAVMEYFSQSQKAAVKAIDIPQKSIDEVKDALFSEADLEQCDTLSETKTCQKVFKCMGSTLKSFFDEGTFAGRIDFYHGEEFKDFILGRISLPTRKTPIDLNKYMCLQFDLIRRFRLMVQANRLSDICSSMPEIKGYRMGVLIVRDVCIGVNMYFHQR